MDSINLAEICGPLPSGGDIAWGVPHGLNLRLTAVLSWQGPVRWGISIEKPTVTKGGNRGKPKRITTVVANAGQTIPELLRAIAVMWEQGEVVVGEKYDGSKL